MKYFFLISIFSILNIVTSNVIGQADVQPPASPVLTLVSVQASTGFTELTWTKSPSADVAGYVLYTFNNGEGYAFDTIWDPSTTTLTYTHSAAVFFSESYVIAAIDNSKNISPLSNELKTIYTASDIDTCNQKISIRWNKYPDNPVVVKGYKILASVNGNPLTEIANTNSITTSFIFSNFETDSKYCFVVQAILGPGVVSGSNKTCIDTKMQRPPSWINADYATITLEKVIRLSFSYDPFSEINNFILERKEGIDGVFSKIATLNTRNNPVLYNDNITISGKVFYYRLSAINNCISPVLTSNIAGIILPELELSGNDLSLKWNQYREWNGNIGTYKIYMNVNGTFSQIAENEPGDTTYLMGYSEIMYNVDQKEVCLFIKAEEVSNPYVSGNVSASEVVCTDILEIITVPNAFTPNNDLINDGFRPVLSFTPKEYRFQVRDRQGYILFETKDNLEEWDGKKGSLLLPPDVYLWFLNVTSPSGKSYTRTGTVAIINR